MKSPTTATFLLAAATFAFASGGISSASASADPDDQAAAEAAIAVFNERVTEAGFESRYTPDITPVEPEELVDEIGFSECLGARELAMEAGGRFEGETARAFSDEFGMTSVEEPLSTDPLEMVFAPEDLVSARVITVDDNGVDALDELVGLMGSQDVADCLVTEFESLVVELVPDSAPGTTAPALEIVAEAESDIGVGDPSARFSLRYTTSFQGTDSTFSLKMVAAVSGHSLVFVQHTFGDEPISDFDPKAELAAIVDALDG